MSGSGTITPIPGIVAPIISSPPENYPLLPLETWRRLIGYNPWHFWGLAGANAPLTSNCNSLVTQYSYQAADAAGRAEIRDAIIQAEDRLAARDLLGFYPAPKYREWKLPFPRFLNERIMRLGYTSADARWITVDVPDGAYCQALGVEALELVATPTLVYVDADGDSLLESWTITTPCPAAITDVKSVAVYFKAADRFTGEGPSDRWRIRPVRIAITGGNLVIKGYAWQTVKPVLYEGATWKPLDAGIATNYAAQLEVYHRYTREGTTLADAQGVLTWETVPYPQLGEYNVPYATYDPAGIATLYARGQVRSKINGIVAFGEAVYDPVNEIWTAIPWYSSVYKYRPPDHITLRYLAGYDTDDQGEMATEIANIVKNYSVAVLRRRICACESANKELYDLQFDLARSSGGDESYAMMSREDLTNPLGTRRGAVLAWKATQGRRVVSGFAP